MTTTVEDIADGDVYALLEFILGEAIEPVDLHLSYDRKQFAGVNSSSIRPKHIQACISAGFIDGDGRPAAEDERVPETAEIVELCEEIEESYPNVTTQLGALVVIENYNEPGIGNGIDPEVRLEVGELCIEPVPISGDELPAGVTERVSNIFGMRRLEEQFSVRMYRDEKIKIAWTTVSEDDLHK